jgi:hypothetical protein
MLAGGKGEPTALAEIAAAFSIESPVLGAFAGVAAASIYLQFLQ